MTRPLRTVTIANGQTTSDSVPIGDGVPVGLKMPAAFTGVSITFQGSVDEGATFSPLYDSSGAAVTVTVGTSRLIALEAVNLVACTHIKLVSSGAEGADRTLTLIMRREPPR